VRAGLAAKNPVLVLKGNNVESRGVQCIGGSSIGIDRLLLDLETHRRRVVIGAAGIVHGSDASLQSGPRHRYGPMQIMGESSDAAAPRKVIADERNATEWFH